MSQKEVINKAKLYITRLEEAGIKIDKAFLYGSCASNTVLTENSDIDIMLVSKEFDKNNDKLAGLVWKLTKGIDTRIEPYIVGLNKFHNDDISPLLQIVKKEGIAI